MKLFLDDVRKPWSSEWTLVVTAKQAIERLEWYEGDSSGESAGVGALTEVSLDHDLKPEHYSDSGYFSPPPTDTGMTVLEWMVEHDVWPTERLIIHTMNPVARKRMIELAIEHCPVDIFWSVGTSPTIQPV